MKKATFKVGDKVYCSEYFGTKIYILESCGMDRFPLQIDGCVAFNEIGKASICLGGLSAIFHATAENHSLLEQLYGVKFEAPPKQKMTKEIIQAMLDDGWHSVPCYVSDDCNGYIDRTEKRFIVAIDKQEYFVDDIDIQWLLAEAFHPHTGKAIIDYVDSKIITE